MAAKTKSELLDLLDVEWQRLMKVVAKVPAQAALLKDDADTSIKDIIGHRAAWIDLCLGWIADSDAGRAVAMPAEGFKWNMLPALNAEIRRAQTDLTWEDALRLLATRKDALVAAINAHDAVALYGGPMAGGNGKWTMGRYVEAAGPSHFRSAAKVLRARLKQLP